MEAAVWKHLPDELIERVLTLLPLSSLLKLRAVSKAWSSLILSQDFINLCTFQSPHFIFLTASGSSTCTIAAFSSSNHTWQTLSFEFLPQDSIFVAASAGGLLCLTTAAQYLVCNPLTRSWKALPAISTPNSVPAVPLLTGMIVDAASKSYRILVAGPDGCNDQRTFEYDSGVDSWSMKGNLPANVFGFGSEAIVIGGCLYALACLPDRLLAYDINAGEWIKMQMPLPNGAVNPHLVHCGDTLLLVAGYDQFWNEDFEEDARPTSIRVWKMINNKKEWELIEAMPDELCNRFGEGGEGFDSYRCIGRGEFLYFTSYDGLCMLSLDLAHRSWHCLPNCKTIVENHSFVDGMFVVELALDIAV